MHIISSHNQVKAMILFNSENGRQLVLEEFKLNEILEIKGYNTNSIDHDVLMFKNESLIAELFEVDEDDYYQKLESRKFIKKILRSTPLLPLLIEESVLCPQCDNVTVMIVINVVELSIELTRVVRGNQIGMVLENLSSWVDFPLWERGLDLLTELFDYLDNLNQTHLMLDHLDTNDPDFIDPKLN